MKRRFLLLALFSILFSINYSLAQDRTIKTGKPYPDFQSYNRAYFYDNGEILMIKKKNAKLSIQKVSGSDLSLISSEEYIDFPDKYGFFEVKKINGAYYLFYTKTDNKSKTLFSREIDFNSGLLTDNIQEIIVIDDPDLPQRYSYGNFEIKLSENENYVLVKYSYLTSKGSFTLLHKTHGFIVFDQDLNKLFSKELKDPFYVTTPEILDYIISNDGEILILARVKTDDVPLEKKVTGLNTLLLRLKLQSEGNGKLTQIKLKDNVIVYGKLKQSKDGRIFCVGFYNLYKNYKGESHGFFRGLINSENELENEKSYDIPLSIINSYQLEKIKKNNTKREEKDGKIGFDQILISDIISRDDGSLLIISEEYSSVSYDGKTATYYTGILLLKVDENGDKAWMQVVPMNHLNKTDDEIMYKYVSGKKSHRFVFMDNNNNIGIKTSGTPDLFVSDVASFLSYTIDDRTGELQQDVLFDSKVMNKVKLYHYSLIRVVLLSNFDVAVELYIKKDKNLFIGVFE